MPKRKSKSKNSEISEKKLKRGSESDNPLAEVFIKTRDSSSSDSSTGKSDSSSSDDSYYRKKRASKKKKKSRSDKKLRKIQDQIDLFQRNVDIKLNYLESLVQTLIKNQGVGSSQRTQAPPPKQLYVPRPSKHVPPPKEIVITEDMAARIKHLSKKIDVPDFPMTGILD